MQNKNPQGNFDPIPDSDQELEKYGVWVKAEPQDLVEEPETEHQTLVIEDATSLETMEEQPEEIEELAEIQDLDPADTDIFEDLLSFEDEELSTLQEDGTEQESLDPSDFELDEPEHHSENQGFDSQDLYLDERLSTGTVSDEDPAFDLDLPEHADPGYHLGTPPGDEAGDMLPDLEIEDIQMDDQHPAPSFDDVGALEADLSSSLFSGKTVSSDLLQKIALELSSIKEELVSLRNQLGELKREPLVAATEDDESEEDGAKGGFFDDEDDDTIALTGDELDNILNTADFTVEPPEDLTMPDILDDTDLLGLSEVPAGSGVPGLEQTEDDQDLLPEDGSYLPEEAAGDGGLSAADEPGIEAIEGDEAFELDLESEDEVSPLDLLPEINVITESPEDTSYLDEETSEPADGFEMEASPLEEVPLVEPDLTNLDLGLEIDEAIAADAAEDLPFMESVDEDEGELLLEEESATVSVHPAPETPEILEEDLTQDQDDDFDSILELDEADDEIILSIDGDEQQEGFDTSDFSESLEEIEEIEEVEPLSMDPFEDETFSELELHREGPRQPDGSWSSEPDEATETTQTRVKVDLPALESEPEPELIEDFENLEFEGDGLLGSQEFEDLGGEDLETLQEIEELSEVEELDHETMIAEPGQAYDEAQTVEAPKAVATGVPKALDPQEIKETGEPVPDKLKQDVKSVLLYLDQLLASLPEEKIEEFASSEYYDTYKKLFEDLGLL